jgi:long-chain acyl-CoA synthetase
MAELKKGLISGVRVESLDDLEARVRLMAGGLDALGVKPGDCVSILMRNDIAFLEASYAAMRLGAYAVPINWHFKGEEVAYVLADSESRVLIGHTDLLAAIVGDLPGDVTVIAVPPPAEVVAAYHLAPARTPDGALDYETWIAAQQPYAGPTRPAPQSMIYTSGTTGHPKGVKRKAPTPEAGQGDRLRPRDDLRAEAGHPRRCCRGRSTIRRRIPSASAPAELGEAVFLSCRASTRGDAGG